MRARVAPSTARSETSRQRPAARTSIRPATLAIAMSMTRTTAALNRMSVFGASPSMTRRRDNGTNVAL
jgi:hypothetical protein